MFYIINKLFQYSILHKDNPLFYTSMIPITRPFNTAQNTRNFNFKVRLSVNIQLNKHHQGQARQLASAYGQQRKNSQFPI